MNEFIENNPDKSIQFLTNKNLDDMIIEFISNKYFPSVKIKNDMINSIHFRCNKNLYSIKNPDNCDNVDSINTIEEENLIEYDKAYRFIYEWILNKDNLSYTNDSIKIVEKYYRIAPL